MLNDFRQLLRQNRNYRYMWIGQVVSEIGDHFNNIAVFSLAMEITHSGLVVSGIMLSRAIPMVMPWLPWPASFSTALTASASCWPAT